MLSDMETAEFCKVTGKSSSSSAFPSYISGVHHFWVIFLRMWPFFNPTIKVVTFRLRGWCVLGVFVLPAFTRLGHERQDLLSPCDEMHVCTDQTSVFTLIRKSFLGNGVWTHVVTPREKSLYRNIFPEEDRTRNAVDSEPKHYQRAIPAPTGKSDNTPKNVNYYLLTINK